MFGLRCSGCGRWLKRRECLDFDDPMAPFGAELLCPQCESRVQWQLSLLGTVLAIGAGVLLAVGVALRAR
jgi:hypothetical protein